DPHAVGDVLHGSPAKKPPEIPAAFPNFITATASARQQAFALQALALQLAIAADRLGPLAGALLARLLVMAPELHLAEDAFTLHLLLQRLQRLVGIVVANDDLQIPAPLAQFWVARGVLEGLFPVHRPCKTENCFLHRRPHDGGRPATG